MPTKEDWDKLDTPHKAALISRRKWLNTARPKQLTPPGDWSTWLLMGGRGAGKTRTGAEDIAWFMCKTPGARIGVIAPTMSDVRDTCFEGVSGLLSVIPKECILNWSPQPCDLALWNGAKAKGFSAEEPDRLRGPQHHRVWCLVERTAIQLDDGSHTTIDHVRVGDRVMTRHGSRRVIAVGKSDNPAPRVRIDVGHTNLTGTIDHPILVGDHWIPMGDIKVGDFLWRQSDTVVSLGGRTRTGILHVVAKVSALRKNISTALFGQMNLVQSLTGWKYTIRTMIQRTTSLITLNLNPRASIAGTIRLGNQRPLNKNNLPRQSFTNVGSLSLAAWQIVLNAARRSLRAACQPLVIFAPNIVANNGVPTLSSPRQGNATFAQTSTWLRKTFSGIVRDCATVEVNQERTAKFRQSAVVSVSRLKDFPDVYNLTVEGEHEFIANGIVVHNCDELGAWRYPDTWDQMQFGLRLGTGPRAIVTTTPRPTVLVKNLIKDPQTILTRESTFANEKNLAASTLKLFRDRYSGTRLGRQELEAEVLDDVPGSLWTRSRLDAMRVNEKDLPTMQRVVVGVDPAVGAVDDGDEEGRAETGIIVAGLGVDGRGYLLSDLSGRFSPDGWARRAVSGIDQFDGDAIVAETNQGGEMVVSTIRSVRTTVRVLKVHAAKGKVTRAEPVSALYEQDRISHVGQFPKLEDQMVAFTTSGIVGDTTGDRVDAMVWAWSELFPRMTKKNTNKGPLKVESVSGYRPHGF